MKSGLQGCAKVENAFCLQKKSKNLIFKHKTKIGVKNWGAPETFFKKSEIVTFLVLWIPNIMQKIRKILRANSEKRPLPTYIVTD